MPTEIFQFGDVHDRTCSWLDCVSFNAPVAIAPPPLVLEGELSAACAICFPVLFIEVVWLEQAKKHIMSQRTQIPAPFEVKRTKSGLLIEVDKMRVKLGQ